MNIAHLIDRGQSLFPDKTALIYEERSYTYTELNELSNRIANLLADLGIAHGDRVALYLPNLPEFVTAFFGIQKVGAIAVAINAALKADEIKYILQDSDTKLTITTETLQGNIEANQLQVLIADQHNDVEGVGNLLTELMNNASARFKTVDMSDNDPAILLYTSGTTGYPKGVMLSHNNLLSNIQMFSYTVHLTPDDRLLLFLPIAHSYGLTSTMLPCFDVCGTLILHRDFEIDTLGQTIANHGVTVFYGVPTIYSLLLDKVSANQMKSVHRYISGGATLASELNQKWQAKFGVIINEEYGMTETSLICFNDFLKRKAGTVGRPLGGVEVQIVDEDDKPVSTGELGEITVRSPGVMLGYWNQPQETAEAIKAGWFHTGDIGRVDEYGYVSIVDRLKEMISVGAQKVYPTEVEHVLYQHPAVEQVAVYGVPESLLGEQVRTSIILKAEVTAEELTIFCRQRLADYKVPAGIEFVDSLPKGKTGKILKKVLREQFATKPQTSEISESTAHKTVDEIQQWLTDWMFRELMVPPEMLEADRPFSDYGMNSSLAVVLVQDLSEWLGHKLAPIISWNYPTVKDLSEYLFETFGTTSSDEDATELNLGILSDEKLAELLQSEINLARREITNE